MQIRDSWRVIGPILNIDRAGGKNRIASIREVAMARMMYMMLFL